MKHVPLLMILAIGLSGCDAAKDLGAIAAKAMPDHAPMTTVIPPGYKMMVGAQAAPVFGSDECPSASKTMNVLFGPNPNEGQHQCIVIAPETKTVSVLVGLKDGPTREIWTVEHSGDRTMLRRADGSYLAEAK